MTMKRLIGLALLLFPLAGVASAQKVHVVTRNIEPFSFEKDGRRIGYAAELWDNVARELKLDYDFTTVGSAKEMVVAVESKSVPAFTY